MLRRTEQPWQLRTRTLPLGTHTLVMGIVNLTPDSFSGDGLARLPDRAVVHALAMLDAGAHLLDLGAESTRPGSHAATAQGISASEEQDRLLPVLEALLRERPEAIVSVDTYRASTAQAALRAGAEIINDVSGFRWDPEMPATCSAHGGGLVLMHTRGTPDDWRAQPALPDDAVLSTVRAGLEQSLQVATAAGIAPQRIVLDPGYGFGKRGNANYALLARQAELLALRRPLLAGLSRKSFLGAALAAHSPDGMPPDPTQRDTASAAAATAAVLAGAAIVRVHAVRATLESVAIADAILNEAV